MAGSEKENGGGVKQFESRRKHGYIQRCNYRTLVASSLAPVNHLLWRIASSKSPQVAFLGGILLTCCHILFLLRCCL